MEDEDVDCITKTNAAPVENRSSCVPVSKEICKIISSENATISPSEDVCGVNSVKLSLYNHQETLTASADTEDNVCSQLTDSSVVSPKKVNGEVDKIESAVSEEGSLVDCTVTNENVEDLKSKELFVSEFEQTNKRKHPSSDGSDEFYPSDDESENKTSSGSSPVEFRGFKKRKILGAEKGKVNFSVIDFPDENERNDICEPIKPKVPELENVISEPIKPKVPELNDVISEPIKSKVPELKDVISEPIKPKVPELRRSARNATMAKRKSNEQVVEHKEENGDQLTEYAQYLGLQPTVKFKCGRCGEKHFQSMASLNAHQKMCSKSGSDALVKPTKPPGGDSNLSTNFRITRKVYLCSACGTYYENWKLFLHMRDMHKRHICLFCLGMFSVADKLAEHLLFKHNVNEKMCRSPEEFLNLFQGSCYLTCCSCEKMFTEREDFFDHLCKDAVSAASASNNDSVVFTSNDNTQRCSLCGIKCGHFQSCPSIHNNRFQNTTAPSTSVNSKNSSSLPSNLSLTKFYIPVPPSIQKEWSNSNTNKPTNIRTTSDKDDYYDVSDAASFCHVDIANDSDTQTTSDRLTTEKTNSECKTKHENHGMSPSKSEENITNDEPSKNTISTNEASSSSDESAPEKRENKSLETNESCKNDNSASQNNDDEKNLDGDFNITDDENDADDEHNSSEDGTVKTPKSVECDGDDDDDDAAAAAAVSNSGVESSDIKDKSNFKENLTSCYIKLNRIEEVLPGDRTDESTSKTDDSDDKKLGNEVEENISGSSDNICSDNVSNSNNSSSPNLKISNASSNESIKALDFKDSESSSIQENNTNDLAFDNETNARKEIINSDNNKLNNPTSPMLAENDFECKENKHILDKSDESEDSDKLSVVLSEDGSEDHEKSKTNDNATSVCEKDSNIQETNVDLENTNGTENDTMFQHADVSNDDSIVHNGNETISDSNNIESQDIDSNNISMSTRKEDNFKVDGEKFQLANEEVMAMALTLENKMDSLSSQFVIKECVRTSCTTCSYCNHAVKICVNGRQLALHLLAEHRYMPVKNETVEDVIERLKNSLDELKDVWFNTDSYDSSDKSCFVPYDHTYDCFQCNYVTRLHKDLYHHYRKVHQKSILYCCMCKANFSSYSELICHMCPGLYMSKDIQFRCCFCNLDRIPSAFRLMVHLRKAHHTCDVCFDIADDQQKLSTHMWKHKLNHSCYRCGISYRNKPDITKHLFWKHGTESVLCKKCLHKRWPHVYHFCVPPNAFICDECNLSFSKAVVLKVHKRMHSGDFPYTCTSCDQKFVSKKLLLKHKKIHNAVPVENDVKVDLLQAPEDSQKTPNSDVNKVNDSSVPPPETTDVPPQETEKPVETPVKQHKKKNKKDKDKKSKPVVDVYDLPPLNLSSESDDSDDEKEAKASQLSGEENQENKEKEMVLSNNIEDNKEDNAALESTSLPDLAEDAKSKSMPSDSTAADQGADNDENVQPVTVVDGIWDSFHSYKAEQEKRENLDNKQPALSELDTPPSVTPNDAFLGDHDYCVTNNVNEPSVDESKEIEKPTPREHSSSIDHDYCTLNNTEGAGSLTQLNQEKHIAETPSKKKQKSPKKKVLKQHNSSSSSDSSSDSDSSCSCGDSSCSCSSSSSNSSSSSSTDSDSSSSAGRRLNSSSINKREKKRDKMKNKRKEEATKTIEQLPAADEEPVVDQPIDPEEPFIRESDLETDETSTDEEFYDKYPQRHANQLLAEKRNQLMVLAAVASENNGTASPPVPHISEPPSVSLVNNAPKVEETPPSTPVPVVTTAVHPSKRKVKSKKRKKSQLGRSNTKSQNVFYETPEPSTSFAVNHREQIANDSLYNVSSPLLTTPVHNRNVVENNMFLSNEPQPVKTESHSSKRQSKRRPVRNKFYGYSSEEEDEHHVRRHPPPSKWKKTTTDINAQQHHVPQQQTQVLNLQQQHHQQLHVQQQQYQVVQSPVVPEYNLLPKVQSSNQPLRNIDNRRNVSVNDGLSKRVSTTGSSSSSEEDSESGTERTAIIPAVPNTTVMAMATEKDDKLYCYCQCPYDEVSEMIACDGVDCVIEWFHFECVGIMVPPKGKWYCPDCRKRRGLS